MLYNVVLASAAAAKSLQSCLTLRPHRQQLTRLPRPWDSPGKNTGVGCHFLLQRMKVKSQSEVKVKSLSRVRPSATLWTAAFPAPPPMGFSRREYWSGVPLPSPQKCPTSIFTLLKKLRTVIRKDIYTLMFTGEGNGNPLQCSRLENPRGGGAWWADVYGVAQSQTRLN